MYNCANLPYRTFWHDKTPPVEWTLYLRSHNYKIFQTSQFFNAAMALSQKHGNTLAPLPSSPGFYTPLLPINFSYQSWYTFPNRLFHPTTHFLSTLPQSYIASHYTTLTTLCPDVFLALGGSCNWISILPENYLQLAHDFSR